MEESNHQELVSQFWEILESSGAQLLTRFLSNLGEEERKEIINFSSKYNVFPLHYLAVLGERKKMKVLLENGGSVRVRSTESYTPLHHACSSGFSDCCQVLLDHGADPAAQTRDSVMYVSGIAVCLPGGRTALHLAAVNQNKECIQVILNHCNTPMDIKDIKDFDGNTAFDCSMEVHGFSICEMLHPQVVHQKGWPPTREQVEKLKLKTMKKQTKRIKLEKKEKEEAEKKKIELEYQKLFPSLFSSHLIPYLLPPFYHSLLQLESGKKEGILEMMEEVIEGVYVCRKMFTNEFCENLILELENYSKSGLPLTRPNTSIPYGHVLNPIGFKPLLDQILFMILEPLRRLLFPDTKELKSQYSFTKHYVYGQDSKPTTHFDPSEITFSLCLGKQFEGSQVYFHELLVGEDQCSGSERPRHESECEDCQLTLTHQIGQVVIHRGRQIHGVYPLTCGERWNLLMWCRPFC